MLASELVTLQEGPLKLVLAPALGGSIAGFWHDDTALMRETPSQAIEGDLIRQTSSYPLIPYSNRIAWGRFAFGAEEYELALNFEGQPHSVHGNAWRSPWQVVEAGSNRCLLVLEHRPDGTSAKGWPFAYRAEQRLVLTPNGLTIALSIINTDHRPMPAGLGLHPFFPNRPGTALRFKAKGVYRADPDSLPAGNTPVPAEWDYGDLRPLGEPALDNCFNGWDGEAEIHFAHEKLALRISADPVFGHLVVYVPTGKGYFAVEPVTHMNDAIHHPEIADNGLQVIQPGEKLEGVVTFGVEAIS